MNEDVPGGPRGGPGPENGASEARAGLAGVEGAPPTRRRWPRVVGLLVVMLALSVMEPAVLVGVPYVLFVVVLPSRRLPALLAAAVAALLVLGPDLRDGFWYVERGWAVLLAGWFLALTFRWPDRGFSARALGSVAGSGAVVGAWVWARPGSWSMMDWLVGERIRGGVATALEAVRGLRGEEGVSQALVTTVYQAADLQAQVFPATVGLASLASLGVAWWLYARLAHGDRDGLGPVREFRFNDHLVWLFIGGLLLLVLGVGEGWSRAGSNAVLFMGALYALRGVAVVMFFYGGVSLFGGALVALGLLFVAPVILGGAMVIGLGDTWLDLRERARALAA